MTTGLFPGGVGASRIDQLLPFQRSISVGPRPSGVYCRPTATQLAELVHDTPFRYAYCTPAGFALATIDHFEPFQVRAIVLVPVAPTAMQNDGLGHATSRNAVPVA